LSKTGLHGKGNEYHFSLWVGSRLQGGALPPAGLGTAGPFLRRVGSGARE